MTTREARHAIYAAATAIDTAALPADLESDALDILDEILDEIRIRETREAMAA